MRREQIISKGKYLHTQPSQLIGVKQYLFVRDDDGKKKLLLRFENSRKESCSKFAFILYRLDVKGNILGEDRFESTEREYTGREIFAFDRMVDVEEKCTDFIVKMVYANYGDYTYHVENNEVSVSYDEKRASKRRRAVDREKARKITSRTFDVPKLFGVISFIVLALVFAATSFLLSDFMKTEEEFSLSGVHYRFADEEKTGVIITGCSDKYRDISLPAVIDDFKVLGIEKDAFKNNTELRKIKIDGIVIDAQTFKDCDKLQTVELVNVPFVGEDAFASCDSLETVKISTNIDEEASISIESGAFGMCQSLKTVSIGQYVFYDERGAILDGSTGVESLTLKSFAFTKEGVSSPETYKKNICTIFGIEADAENDLSLKKLSIDFTDMIPSGFVKGFKSLESVSINESEIKTVGNEAFMGCNKLSTISLKGLCEEIGSYAFSETAISQFDFSAVKALGTHVFMGAKNLSTVVGYGTSGITSIPNNTFEGCTSLTRFELTEEIASIGDEAFKGAGLVYFKIPHTVTDVGNGILSKCDKIEELNVYTLGQDGCVASYFGVDKLDNTDNYFAQFIPKSLKTISLGEGKVITSFAFAGCTGVEAINLPEGVTEFGDYAFDGCTSLKTIDIPSTTLVKIGQYALSGTAIEVVELPTTLEYIGYGALEGCNKISSLTLPFLGESPADGNGTIAHIFGSDMAVAESKIPLSLNTITLVPLTPIASLPKNAFRDCQGASVISFPSTVTYIGEAAFVNCKKITSLDLTNVEYVGADAFSGCSLLSAVTFSTKLLTIGDFAFENSGIAVLDLPNSVAYIGTGIISECQSIVSIKVPFLGSEYTSSGNNNIAYLFGAQSTKLDNVPTSLTTITISMPFYEGKIANDAFYGCTNVSSFNFMPGIEKIGANAFAKCAKLSSFNFSSITSIGTRAFEGTGLTDALLGDGIKILDDGVFLNCTSLDEVYLPEGLLLIGDSTFENTALTEIDLPSSIETIFSGAFRNTKLTNLTVPSTVESIGTQILQGCNDIESITFPLTYDVTSLDYLFDTEAELPSSLKHVTINGSFDGIIYEQTFAYCKNLVEIIIDCYITEVQSGAFYSCSELRYVALPSSVQHVETDAFALCYHLYEVSCHDAGLISGSSLIAVTPSYLERASTTEKDGYKYACYNGEWYLINYPKGEAFKPADQLSYKGSNIEGYSIPTLLCYKDSEIKTVTLSSMVASLGTNAFMECGSIEEFEFIENGRIKTIHDGMFANLTYLKRVVLPYSVTSIGSGAFEYCTALETVEMPNELETIGANAFVGCHNLNMIRLYANVREIGENAFLGCTSLYDLYSKSSLDIVAGAKTHGYVARYAVKVQTNMAAEPSYAVSVDGIGEFRRSGGSWLLMNGYNIKNLVLDSFKYEDVDVQEFRIASGAFSNLDMIETVVIGNAVKQIQQDAFAYCPWLKSVDFGNNKSLKEIEDGTFSGCYRLRFATLPSSVRTIGAYAFYECSLLESINLQSNLESIGDYAFANCVRLVSVKLPAPLSTIGYDAFVGCYNLIEVCNLSLYIDVQPHSVENGRVGEFAQNVCTSESGMLPRYEENGLRMIKANEKWYLYSYIDNGSKILTIPARDSDIMIMSFAFIDTTFEGIVMPIQVKYIQSGIFYDESAFNTVYYEGTEKDWYFIHDDSYLIDYYSVYFFSECIHKGDGGLWRYDEEGEITIDDCPEHNELTKEPTCFEFGIRTYYCSCQGCDYSREESEPTLEHTFENNICTACGSKNTLINEETMNDFVQNKTIEIMHFNYNKELGAFVSSNQVNYSDGRLIITAREKMSVYFDYTVSSQENGDYLIILHNGNEVIRASGEATDSFYALLNEGDTVVINYSKDGKESDGSDRAYIKNLQFAVAPTEDEPENDGPINDERDDTEQQ